MYGFRATNLIIISFDFRSISKAYLLMNVDCSAVDSVRCKQIDRTFHVLWDTPLSNVDNAVVVAFFDINENVSFGT